MTNSWSILTRNYSDLSLLHFPAVNYNTVIQRKINVSRENISMLLQHTGFNDALNVCRALLQYVLILQIFM